MRNYGLVLSVIGLSAFAAPPSHAARIITPSSGTIVLVQDDCGPECREHRRFEREREREREEAEHRHFEREREEAEHRRWEEEHHRRWEDEHR